MESVPPRYHLYQFLVKMDKFEFFGLNLAKLPSCVRYSGSNDIEGVAESWVEAEMSWVEVDGAEGEFKMSWMEVDGAGWSWVEVGGAG